MKNIIFASAYAALMAFSGIFIPNTKTNDNDVKPVNVVETPKETWHIENIYDVHIVDGKYEFNGKEILLSEPIKELIKRILHTDNIAFPSEIDIDVLYVADEDLYIANLCEYEFWLFNN